MIANDATRISPTESNGAAVVSDSVPSANADTSRTTARRLSAATTQGNSRARWAESIEACTRDVKSRFSRRTTAMVASASTVRKIHRPYGAPSD